MSEPEVGNYVKIFFNDDSHILVCEHEEPRVDAAVSRWIDSGRTWDSLLSLETVDGCTYKCLASFIAAWYVSTPEARRSGLMWEHAYKRDRDALRQELGIWEEE